MQFYSLSVENVVADMISSENRNISGYALSFISMDMEKFCISSFDVVHSTCDYVSNCLQSRPIYSYVVHA